MSENELLGPIAINRKVMVGKPVIKGMRLAVEYVPNLPARGTTFEGILREYEGPTWKIAAPAYSSQQSRWRELTSCLSVLRQFRLRFIVDKCTGPVVALWL